MTNATTSRQLGRKAMKESITPDAEVAAQVSVQLAIAHALLDVAAAIRELQPIESAALGPVNIDTGETYPPSWQDAARPDKEDSRDGPTLSDKIRRDLAGRGGK